jgi:hypothetical protein
MLLLFNERDFNVPVGLRVAFLYSNLVFISLAAILLVYAVYKKTLNQLHLLILGVMVINVLLFITNPGNLIDHFFG